MKSQNFHGTTIQKLVAAENCNYHLQVPLNFGEESLIDYDVKFFLAYFIVYVKLGKILQQLQDVLNLVSGESTKEERL
jgi:hypothetical protein